MPWYKTISTVPTRYGAWSPTGLSCACCETVPASPNRLTLEFDIQAMIEGNAYSEFVALYRLLHAYPVASPRHGAT